MYQYKNPKELFHGKRVDFLSIEVEDPQGKTICQEIISHPGAVVILPLLDKERIILIQNRREAVQEVLWELPAGTLEKQEDPLMCAARELEEETGYRAGEITHLFNCYSTPGFCNEKLYIYRATDLTQRIQKLDAMEEIKVVVIKLMKALEMIKAGTIRDSKTIATLLYFVSFIKEPYPH
ncbi:MAG: NUDIX hydrolase [Chlamydiales bacterium]